MRLSTGVGVGQLSPIRGVFVTRSSCAEQSQVFVSSRQYFLRHSTAMELGSYPLLELLLSKEGPARSSCMFLSPSQYFMRLWTEVGVGQLSSIRAVIVARNFCAEQSQVFVSPRQYFLRLSTAMELSSYPLLELLLSKEGPARSSCMFLSPSQYFMRLWIEVGVGQLSSIRGVFVTRSSCAERSQVFVSRRQYFLRNSTARELGSYPLLELLFSK